MANPLQPQSPSLLGNERGVDHVGIAVKDLEAARKTYHERLGFDRPIAGTLPNGIKNINYYFEDATYLETLTHTDRKKSRLAGQLYRSAQRRLVPGASIFSVQQTTDFLSQRGFAMAPPVPGMIHVEGQKEATKHMWQTLFFKHPPLPGDPLYFIAYQRNDREQFLGKLTDKAIRRRYFRHANTALGIKAVAIAVTDLTRAAKAYQAVGLTAGDRFSDPRLGASGQRFAAGQGEILLLGAEDPQGRVATFLKQRGPGIIGLSIQVASLLVVQRLISKNLRASITSYAGLLGKSVSRPARADPRRMARIL